MNNKNFRMDNLKKIRIKKNITQIKLSTEIEVSQELISHYETGQSKPNIEHLIKLSNYLNCSTDFLLGQTNDPSPIKKLSSADEELKYITLQYNSLSQENKKQLISYLKFLCQPK